MSKTRKLPQPKPQQLLVEGKNDRHVIWALCELNQLPETFSVELPEENGTEGIEALLDGLRNRFRNENLRTLGIVVDADLDVATRWLVVGNRLRAVGYQDIPASPPAEGWVYAPPNLPKVGVWLMPNNQFPGMLEDFAAHLIPSDNALRPKAESILHEIERDRLNPYNLIHRPKAMIHTWLAWQETPGMPMGQAITAKVLSSDSPLALVFVEWLNRLFD